MEKWESIIETKGRYEISSFGRIKTVSTNRIWYGHYNNATGYYNLTFKLKSEDVTSNFLVHRLVAQYFIPNPENKPQINHIDNDPKNNHMDNLEWVTVLENTLHRVNQSRQQRGINHHKAKLNEEDVREIRKLLNEGLTHKTVAEMYKVSKRTIGEIKRGNIWKHVS